MLRRYPPMTNAQIYLEKVRSFLKARDHRDSDYYIAQTLAVSKSSVSKWKSGTGGIDIREGYRIALLLGEDPLSVVYELHRDEFKDPETREFFKVVLDNQKDSEDAA